VCLVEKHTQTKVKRGTQSHVSISTHFPSVGVCMYVRCEGRVTDGRGGVSYEEQVTCKAAMCAPVSVTTPFERRDGLDVIGCLYLPSYMMANKAANISKRNSKAPAALHRNQRTVF